MTALKVIREQGADESICYIVAEPDASAKLDYAILDYEIINGDRAADILTAYSQYVAFGARETGDYVFTDGGDADWFITQVAVKSVGL